MTVFGVCRRAVSREEVSVWRWIGATGIGFLIVGLFLLGAAFESSRPRYIEFQGDKLFLAGRGAVPVELVMTWSSAPDPMGPSYTRLCWFIDLG